MAGMAVTWSPLLVGWVQGPSLAEEDLESLQRKLLKLMGNRLSLAWGEAGGMEMGSCVVRCRFLEGKRSNGQKHSVLGSGTFQNRVGMPGRMRNHLRHLL